MAAIIRSGRQLMQRPPSPARKLTNRQFRTINREALVDEEKLPYYRPEQFYPVHIGEIFTSKYQVLGKLGYGAYSTVWLCRDLSHHRYVALKICTRTQMGRVNRELEAYERLTKLNSLHRGQAYIREVYDTFEIYGPDGCHICLVHPPLHMTISALQRQGLRQRYNEELLRQTLIRLFRALDFLHNVANVIHTDIKAANIMLTINDESMLTDFEKAEQDDPTPRKVIDTKRTIYTTRQFRSPKDGLWGEPVLCDFGQARIGKLHRGDIQPEIYKAPEVLFEMEWSYSVDIWNVGAMIWDMFENKHMFNALDENQKYSPSHHVAEMVAYFGLPPLQFIQRSEVTRNVFDDDGNWTRTGGVVIPRISFEDSEENLEGRNKELFLQFMRSMLHWVPEERKSASELLLDPWLNELL